MAIPRFIAPPVALLALILSGCGNAGGEQKRASVPRATGTEHVQVAATPSSLLHRCQQVRGLAPACPRRLPPASTFQAREIARVGSPYRTFNMEAGVSYADPARDAPPAFVHVVVEAGDLHDSFASFGFSTKGPVTAPTDGLTRSEKRSRLLKRVPQAVFLGRVTWGGINGVVVLAPPYNAVSSIHGGHLIFRWRRGGTAYALSLHAWEPFSESFATLRAMVESIDAR